MNARRVCAISLVCLAAARSAAAQSPVSQVPAAQRPVEGRAVVQKELAGTIVWRAGDDTPFTLRTLVEYVAPIIWFSPDEPLLRAGAHLPEPLPLLNGSSAPDAPSHVYYNVPLLQLHDTSACSPLVGKYDATKHPLSDETLIWNDEQGAAAVIGYPPLDCLDFVKIRFFLYYTSEVGVSAHDNDFESVQVNIRIRADKQKDPSSTECATKPVTNGHCALVSGVFGSAHGIAWYTNGLSVDNNRDALFPLSVLVEEGKHASAPDRNADGIYTPGFDVDIHPNDAWGIRDILRTRWLQGPAFRSDMSKRRLERDRVYPAHPNLRLKVAWLQRNDWPADAWTQTYELEDIHKATGGLDDSGQPAPYCDASTGQLSKIFEDRRPKPGCIGEHCEALEDLFRGEEGCRLSRVYPVRGWQKIRRGFARLNIGGSLDEYLTWPRLFAERVAPGFRVSGTSKSGWWIPPVGWNVPGVDGWATVRWNFWRHHQSDSPLESPVDLMYSVSAARYVSSYLAIGRDTLPLTDAQDPGGHRTALEAGIKWRFSIPKVGVFSGVRIGLRADDPTHLSYPRVIVEVGGGSW